MLAAIRCSLMFTAVTASLFCVRPAQAFTVTPLWITSNSGVPIPPADTLPNAAFVDDPAVVSDKRLDSLPIPLPPASSLQLTFRHNFNLEASDMDPNLGFDGGVLELSAACLKLRPTMIHFEARGKVAASNSTNAVSFSSACTMKRFP